MTKRLEIPRYDWELLPATKARIKEALFSWDQRYTYKDKVVYIQIGDKWVVADTRVHYKMYRTLRHMGYEMTLANGCKLGSIPCYFVRCLLNCDHRCALPPCIQPWRWLAASNNQVSFAFV